MIVALELRPPTALGWLLDDQTTVTQALTRPLPANSTPAHSWLQLVELARELCFAAVIEPAQLERIVLVFPGALSAQGIVQDAGGGFGGYDLKRGLREHLRTDCELVVSSATVADAWAQHHAGVLRDCDSWLALSLESLECAAQVRGRWLQPQLAAQVLERGGPLDDYGKRGSWRAYCASRAFEERARSYALNVSLPQLWALVPSNFAAQSLAQDYVSRLAQGLANGIAALRPARVCLSGELARALFALIHDDLVSQLRDLLPPDLWRGDVVLSAPGEPGGITPGALALASLGAVPL